MTCTASGDAGLPVAASSDDPKPVAHPGPAVTGSPGAKRQQDTAVDHTPSKRPNTVASTAPSAEPVDKIELPPWCKDAETAKAAFKWLSSNSLQQHNILRILRSACERDGYVDSTRVRSTCVVL